MITDWFFSASTRISRSRCCAFLLLFPATARFSGTHFCLVLLQAASSVKKDKPAKEAAPLEQGVTEPTAPPRPVEEGKLVYLKLSELHPFHTFRPHPFKVRDDAKMQETVASIKLNGVMVPGLARPEKDGNGYEIVAGHRRCRGSELAGLEEMPFIVRDMTDHEAVEAMKDSNKQRDQTLPSELAALLDLEVEDIKHQGSRLKNVAEGDVGKRSVEIVGEAHGMNYKKVMRYLRLNHLVPELMDKVDDKKMVFMPAVELSYIKPKNQRLIAVSIDGEQASPSLSQAKQLRELDKEGKNGWGSVTLDTLNDGVYYTISYDGNLVYDNINVGNQNTLSVRFALCGAAGSDYQVSFLADHQPISNNAVLSYQASVTKGNLLIVDAVIDVSRLDDFTTFYVMAVPVGDTDSPVYKTNSILLYKEA